MLDDVAKRLVTRSIVALVYNIAPDYNVHNCREYSAFSETFNFVLLLAAPQGVG